MNNHVHLLLETREPNLGAGMKRLHGSYVQRFHARHGSSGHLFQGRYGAKCITTDEQLWTAAAYIAMNPVEAGLCRRPDAWPWSSHSMVLSGTARTGSTSRTCSSTSRRPAVTGGGGIRRCF